MRLASVLAGLLLVGLPVAPSRAALVADQRPLQPDGELRIRMEAGRITLRAATEPQVRVSADLFPAQAIRWRGDEGALALIIDDSTRLRPRLASVQVMVPAGVRLFLSVGNAEVDAEGVGAGGLVISGGDGDIRVSGSSGPLAADTRAGRIDADLGPAGAQMSTLSGAISVRAAQGPARLNVQSLSGAIELSLSAPARVKAATVSGDISAQFDSLQNADVRLETLRGALALDLVKDAAARIELELVQGKVSLPPEAQQQPDGTIRLGEGGGRLHVGSFTGTLTVATTRTQTLLQAVTPLTSPEPNPQAR